MTPQKSNLWQCLPFLLSLGFSSHTRAQETSAPQNPPGTKTPIVYVEESVITRPWAEAKLNGQNVRVRSIPSKNGRIVGIMKGDETFQVVKKGDWYEIKTGPYKGKYIAADLVESDDDSQETAQEEVQPTPTVTASTPAPIPSLETEPPIPPSNVAPDAPGPVAFKVAPPAAKPATASAAQPAPAVPPGTTSTQKTPGWDEQMEKRFEEQVKKAFQAKKPKTVDNRVVMPVFVNNSQVAAANLNTQVHEDGKNVDIESQAFFEVLKKNVDEKWFDKPEVKTLLDKSKSGGFDWVSIAEFRDSGVNIEYNELKLAIVINVPAEWRITNTQSLAGGRDFFEKQNIDSQSIFSSYLNINATETFDSRNTSFKDRRSPLQAQFENGTNIGNFVIEAYGKYVEDRDTLPPGANSFTRDDVRLVRDFQSITARASAGDVVYPVQGFQVFRPMQGGAIRSQFSMSPSKLTYPSGNYEVFLKNKSKVYIFVNDQLQQVLDLPAGRHQIKDFQYTGGMNKVRFDIVDEFGQSESIDYSYFSSTELLKPGLHQFSYAYGNPTVIDPSTSERTYNTENSTFSGFHRYGFSDYFSGGINGQFDQKQSLVGLEATWSLKIGYLQLEPSYSNVQDVGTGYALATNYTYIDYAGPEKSQRSFNLGMIYRSDLFLQLGTLTQSSVVRPFEITAGVTRGISKTMSANFGANYVVNKNTSNATNAENSYSLRGGLSKRWKNGISVNGMASHLKTSGGNDKISLMAFLLWSFPKERQTISASTNTADSSSRLGWSYNPGSGADTASYQANYRNNQTEKGYGGNVAYNGNRSRMAASHEVVLPKNDDPGTVVIESEKASSVTNLQFGTALVFAGGRFGIGRPVTDSFAILAPVKNLKGQKLFVNPDSQGTYLAKTDWLGAAVVPELSSYNPSALKVEGKDLPLGTSIPQDHFYLYPRYKSGYGFTMGSDADIYMKCLVVMPNGAPVEMAAGIATNLDDIDAPPVTVFTNRRGIIQSEGFKSGRYSLVIEGDKYKPIEFEIPEDAKEEFDLGTLKLQEK